MKTKIILMMASSVILLSCGSGSSNKETVQSETIIAPKHEESIATSIELNNGEKWKVDERMMAYIRDMEMDIFIFSKAKQKDYKSLAYELQQSIDLLVSSCTMEGKAHDELHKWLLPFMDLVKDLSSPKNSDASAKEFEKIQTSFTTFNQYFN